MQLLDMLIQYINERNKFANLVGTKVVSIGVKNILDRKEEDEEIDDDE